MSEVMESSTALVPLEKIGLPVKFSTEEVTDILAKIKASVAAEADGLDISTEANRDKIKSLAYKIARTKTALDETGKTLVSEIKARSNLIDAERRRVRDELDALKEEVRRPVTEWEEAEKARIKKHEDALAHIEYLANLGRGDDLDSATIDQCQDALEAYLDFNCHDWQEFTTRAEKVIAFAREDLTRRLERAKQREAEVAELERLRAAEAERQRKEHEAQIAADAAENARREAEEKARVEAAAEAARVAAERQAIEDAAKAERDAADARERALEEQRKQAELDRIAAENRAAAIERQRIADAEAAERLRKDQEEASRLAAARAAEQAKRDQEAAIAAERERVAKIAADEEAARVRREADKAHRAKINAAARDAIVLQFGTLMSNDPACATMTDASAIRFATEIVKAIARGEIPHCRLEY